MDDRPFLLNRDPKDKVILIQNSDVRFDDKKNTLGGKMALIIAIVSAVGLIGSIVISYQVRGEGSIIIGVIGIAGMLLALSGFIISILSFREEDHKYVVSTIALIMNVILLLLWGSVYLIGI